jgi:arylsulfatase A-like enzyme
VRSLARTFLWAALLLLFLFRPAPASNAACADCNIIFLSLGNVGAQHMSLYGYGRPTTPRLDRFARGALVFEEAFSPASWTLPAAATLLTGLHPYSHRMLHRLKDNALDPAIRTLPEILRDAGWRTAAFTGGLDYYRGFSTMRGFQETDANPNFTGLTTTLGQAKAWLARNRGRRFFLLVHGYDAHCPFTPPDGVRGTFSGPRRPEVTVDESRCVRGTWRPRQGRFETTYSSRCPDFPKTEACSREGPERVSLTEADLRHLRDLYDEEVLSEDAAVGGFLAGLDKTLLAKTIVVVFAEHGEMFAKHGRFGRAGTIRGTLYDDVVHVPLLMRVPGFSGRRVSGLVDLADLAPTVAGLLGVRIPHSIQGRDLAPLIRAGTPVRDRLCTGLPFMWQPPPFRLTSVNESIRDREWKLIREVSYPEDDWRARLRRLLRLPPKQPREMVELYRVASDPSESRDLAAAHPDLVQRLRRDLAAWAARAQAFQPRAPRSQPVPKELLEDARKHGYW